QRMGHGYQLSIFDETTGDLLYSTLTQATGTVSVGWNATPHTYMAYVADAGSSDPPADVQAASDPLTIEPLTGIASVYYTIHSWNSDADPSSTAFDITAAGQGLAGSGPCASVSCT